MACHSFICSYAFAIICYHVYHAKVNRKARCMHSQTTSSWNSSSSLSSQPSELSLWCAVCSFHTMEKSFNDKTLLQIMLPVLSCCFDFPSSTYLDNNEATCKERSLLCITSLCLYPPILQTVSLSQCRLSLANQFSMY